MTDTQEKPAKPKRDRKPRPSQFDQMLAAVTSMSLDKVVEFHNATAKYMAEEKAKLEGQLKLLEGL